MTANGDYVPLHVHSDFSFIDGAAKTAALADAAKRAGHSAIALTDHGSVSGAIEFWKACDKVGVKPILGCEAYLAPGLDELAHTRKGSDEDGAARINPKTGKKKSFDYNHFTLLAKNDVGWKNLQKLTTIASCEGYYYRPRMSWALLTKYREGLIALSGCLSGQLSEEINEGHEDRALEHAKRWKSLFGDDYYIELMPADHLREQALANDGCLRIAKTIGSKIVATGDIHYIDPTDAEIQEIKICVNNHKTLAENRDGGLNMDPVYYYKGTGEMGKSFTGYQEALLNTREVAEKCQKVNPFPPKGKYYLPKFITPDGSTSRDYFVRLCNAGLIERYGMEGAQKLQAKLDFEIKVIAATDFIDYFLVVADFCAWARNNGVPVGPGRGSGAGSVAVYCLGITDIDPIRYELLFERFINPERVSMPDIDIDFCQRGRHRVIEYVRQKYGEECVSQIITFGESGAKSSIKDVARTIGYPMFETNKLASMIPGGPNVELSKCIDTIPELKAVAEKDPQADRVLKLALQLEGLNRNPGRHAAAIVIGDMPLIERIPLVMVGPKKDRGKCTAFSMNQVEAVGLLKMDFLGLETLTQIYDTVELIERTRGIKIDPRRLPVRDNQTMETTTGSHQCWIHNVAFSVCQCCDKTLDLLRRTEVNGVFQVEGGGIKRLLKNMKPDRFDDLVALVALYRPGPLGSGMHDTYVKRKNGEEPVEYEHPALEKITKKTYGVWCYQEQLMQLSVAIAGFTMPQADALRKATGKKDADGMAKIEPLFIPGCVKHGGMAEDKAREMWAKIVFFSQYSFNLAHSAAYAMITWWTAWLKANYHFEFMAALLTSKSDVTDKLAVYIDEVRRWNIEIMPPDVNSSDVRFSVQQKENGNWAITYALSAIKGVSETAAAEVVVARNRVGRFRSILHFFEEVDGTKVGAAAAEAMAMAGAFSSTGASRAQLLTPVPREIRKSKSVTVEDLTAIQLASKQGRNERKERAKGQTSLFDATPLTAEQEQDMLRETDLIPTDVMEHSQRKLGELERDSLGFYLTTHPLADYMELIMEYVSVVSTRSREMRGKARFDVVMGGMVNGIRTIIDKRGAEMAFLAVEDANGPMEIVCFGSRWAELRSKITPGAVLFFSGDLDNSRELPTLKLSEVYTLEEAPKHIAKGRSMTLIINDYGFTKELREKVLDILHSNPGTMPVYWARLSAPDLRRPLDDVKTSGTPQVRQEIRNVLDAVGRVLYE